MKRLLLMTVFLTVVAISLVSVSAVADTNETHEFEEEINLDYEVLEVEYSPDGKYMAVGTTNAIRVFDTETGQEVYQDGDGMLGYRTEHISFTSDGNYIAYRGGTSDYVSVYETGSWNFVRGEPDHGQAEGGNDFDIGGDWIASVGGDGNIYVSNFQTGDGAWQNTYGTDVESVRLRETGNGYRIIIGGTSSAAVTKEVNEADLGGELGIEHNNSHDGPISSIDTPQNASEYSYITSNGAYTHLTSTNIQSPVGLTTGDYIDVSTIHLPQKDKWWHETAVSSEDAIQIYEHKSGSDGESQLRGEVNITTDGPIGAVAYNTDSYEIAHTAANSVYIYEPTGPRITDSQVITGDGREIKGQEYITTWLSADEFTVGVDGEFDEVEWYVNNESVHTGNLTYQHEWSSDEKGENEVRAVVRETEVYGTEDEVTWTVSHEDVDPPTIADSYVDIGVYDEIFTDKEIESAVRSEDTFAIETGEDVHEVQWYIDGVKVESENVSSTGPFMFTTQWTDAGEHEVVAEGIREEGEGLGINYVSWDVTVYEILIGGQDSFSESEGGTFHVTQQFEVFGTDRAEINYTLEYDEDALRLISGETSGTVASGMTRTWEFQAREPGYSGNAITITAEYEDVESTKEIHVTTRRSGGSAGAAMDDFFDTVLSNTWLEWLVGSFVDLGQSTYIQIQTALTGGLLSGVWLHHFGTISLPVGGWTLEQLRPRTKVGFSAIVGAVGIGFVLPWILVISVLTALGWYFSDPIASRFSEVTSQI